MGAADLFDLDRFVQAQNPVFPRALEELRSGCKRSHWMWYIFPQVRGLGSSPTAYHYGVASIEEAKAYVAHPVLGPRLIQCTTTVLDLPNRSLAEIFGSPDDLKFCSCMTLFALTVAERESVFQRSLDRYCAGRSDERTLTLLQSARS